MKKVLLGTVCALAIAGATPAAADWTGTLAGDGGWASWSNGEGVVGLHGAMMAPLDMDGLTFQANADYRYVWGPFFVNIGDFDGTLFWTGDDVRVALTAGAKLAFGSTDWNFGAGIEWHPTPDWRLAAKIMDVTNGFNAVYYGGEATYYWNPNLAFTAGAARDNFDDVTDLSLKGEYQAWDCGSLYGTYTFETQSSISAIIVGFKFYFDGGGSLVDRQRSGPLTFIPGRTNIEVDT